MDTASMCHVLWLILVCSLFNLGDQSEDGFIFNGFHSANLSLAGISSISTDGLLAVTNATKQTKGQAFYRTPLDFRSSPYGAVRSFSTTFVFAIVSEYWDLGCFGLTFAIAPSEHPGGGLAQYMGLLNATNNGNASNHIIAVELDIIQNPEFKDINDNHVGIDVNNLESINSHTAGYYTDSNREFKNLGLTSGDPMQVWVEYDATKTQLNVTLAPINIAKPKLPLLSSTINLSNILLDSMYVGFTAAEGNVLTSHYITGWSFKMGGEAPRLNLSGLPPIPRRIHKEKSKALAIWLPISASVVFIALVATIICMVIRRIKYAELLEDWEKEYGPHRFAYKDLYDATHGFKESELLGSGGFGSVYRGVLAASKMEVAVKRVSHESRQGMKEFVAEIVSIGQLWHRNLVRLLGYCRREGELLLVYDYMPNGSLDKYLFSETKPRLEWCRRFQIIRGVASCLLYLHEDWDKVVIHRDIKASNVLLDREFNARLGDFGLARLYDHGTDPQTTHVVGTMGYLAPELTRMGKATTKTDVFAFGAFLLEVASGRRPIEASVQEEEPILVDCVLKSWKKGAILEMRDHRLGDEYVVEEMVLVLKLGLLCCHPLASARPSMRQVVQFLEGDVPLPELSPAHLTADILALMEEEAPDGHTMSSSLSVATASVLSCGR